MRYRDDFCAEADLQVSWHHAVYALQETCKANQSDESLSLCRIQIPRGKLKYIGSRVAAAVLSDGTPVANLYYENDDDGEHNDEGDA